MRRKHAAAAVSPFWSDTLDEFESDSELEFEFESDFESYFEITGPHPQVDTVLPRKGPGFYSYHPGSPKRQYGTARTILALQAIGARWLVAHPGGPRIGIGDISFPGGGKMSPHVSHQLGVDVDLRLMRSDGKEAGGTYRDSTYSRALTQELVDIIRANTVQGVKMILNNDPKIKGVKPWHGHDDHLHVR